MYGNHPYLLGSIFRNDVSIICGLNGSAAIYNTYDWLLSGRGRGYTPGTALEDLLQRDSKTRALITVLLYLLGQYSHDKISQSPCHL